MSTTHAERARTTNTNAPIKPIQARHKAAASRDLPAWLVKSAIYRRLPIAERAALDRAIIFRPPGAQTLEAIAENMQLEKKYGISTGTLKAYAKRIEQLVRPEITSHVLAGVLGCLPQAYRRHLAAGGEVILISRILSALNTTDTGLTVAEMARLASLLASMQAATRANPARPAGRPRPGKSSADALGDPASPAATSDAFPIKLAESVRLLYGLDWPPTAETRPAAADPPPTESSPN